MLAPDVELEYDPAIEAERRREAFRGVIGKLARQADEWVGQRKEIELRWLEDLRQYHGQVDSESRAKLDELARRGEHRSRALVNVTRTKTNAQAARLVDMLFPTDERCWAIEPTPVPELSDEAEQAAEDARKARREAAAAPEGPEGEPARQQATITEEHYNALRSRILEAEKRAEAMQREIDDQLKESRFAAHARDIIEDGCRVGAGVLEAPVVNERVRRGWRKREAQPGAEVYELEVSNRPRPGARRIDYWNFFPDPDARSLDENPGCYVRSLETKTGMRRVARLPGVDKAAVRRLIDKGADGDEPWYVNELRTILGSKISSQAKRWCVWRYVGPLDAEDLGSLANYSGDDYLSQVAAEADPLDEISVEILFCGEELLRVEPHPLDSGECPFSIFTLERDEASVWGYGVPYMIRNETRIMNAAWRAMMDNAGVAAGPQVVRGKKVQSADGTNVMRPWQVWIYDDEQPGQAGRIPFELIQPDMNQQQLANIIAMARAQIDDVTSMPQIQQGEQGENTTKTVGGMAMLMSSGNVIFRRTVRGWDDDLMVPCIRRMYDWNMQHGTDDAIKGDYSIIARGSSVLLVRELQAVNLQWLMANFSDDPDIDIEQVKSAFFRSMLMSADTFIRSAEERETWLARRAEEQGPSEADIKMQEIEVRREEIDAKMSIAEMETDRRLQEANIRHETAMMSLAQHSNMKMEELEAVMRDSRETRASKERTLAVEAAMSEREAARAAQQGRDPMGSGGYIA